MSSMTGTLITVVSGVLVYILGQMFMFFILEPIKKYKEIKSEISYYLVLHACKYTNTIELENTSPYVKKVYDDASDDIRVLAAKLKGFVEERWFINFIAIPNNKKIEEASRCLIGISNSFISCDNNTHILNKNNREHRDQIRKLLKLK